MPSFSFWVIAVLNFTQKKQLFFWVMTLIDPFQWVWGNKSSRQRKTELRFWPRGVLIAVQMPFKEFWKSQTFTETGCTQTLRFGSTLTPIYPLKMTKMKSSYWAFKIIQNQGPISFHFSVKIIILLCAIWAVFRVQMAPGSKTKRWQFSLAALSQKPLIKV